MKYVMTYKNLNLEANRLMCALLTRAYSVEMGTILCKSLQMQFFLLNYMKLCIISWAAETLPGIWKPIANPNVDVREKY